MEWSLKNNSPGENNIAAEILKNRVFTKTTPEKKTNQKISRD